MALALKNCVKFWKRCQTATLGIWKFIPQTLPNKSVQRTLPQIALMTNRVSSVSICPAQITGGKSANANPLEGLGESMAIIWKAPVRKAASLLSQSGKRELFWYGVTIGQVGFGILASEKRQPTKRVVDKTWRCPNHHINSAIRQFCGICGTPRNSKTVG